MLAICHYMQCTCHCLHCLVPATLCPTLCLCTCLHSLSLLLSPMPCNACMYGIYRNHDKMVIGWWLCSWWSGFPSTDPRSDASTYLTHTHSLADWLLSPSLSHSFTHAHHPFLSLLRLLTHHQPPTASLTHHQLPTPSLTHHQLPTPSLTHSSSATHTLTHSSSATHTLTRSSSATHTLTHLSSATLTPPHFAHTFYFTHTHSLTYPSLLTHPHSLTRSFARSLTQALTHTLSFSQSLVWLSGRLTDCTYLNRFPDTVPSNHTVPQCSTHSRRASTITKLNTGGENSSSGRIAI